MVLYALGSNGSGQLGIGHASDVAIPTRCHWTEKLEKDCGQRPILKIAGGGNHTLLLHAFNPHTCQDLNIAGVLNVKDSRQDRDEQLVVPAITSFPHLNGRIKFCSTTWEAAVVVAELDNLYTYGSGTRGELGRGEDLQVVQRPFQALDLRGILFSSDRIVDLASSLNHTVMVLSNGKAYGWGNGTKGQLGEPAEIVWKPREIEGVGFPVFRAVCGNGFTYLVGDPAQGRHTVIGAEKWNIRSHAPESVIGWQDLGASWGSIFVLDLQGKIISWGRNDHGQLAPEDLPPVMKMAVGSEHVLALSKDGRVLAWGWGEHGNCGPKTDEDGDVKHGWNEISITETDKASVIGVGAGCATSWIWTDAPQSAPSSALSMFRSCRQS